MKEGENFHEGVYKSIKAQIVYIYGIGEIRPINFHMFLIILRELFFNIRQ
jgi:hypothetical protein